MGNCSVYIREERFIIEDELTQCYVFLDAVGDCPIGVQGWHHKTFPATIPVVEIMTDHFSDFMLWPLDAPPGD
jgi:hypothetical protein